MNETPIDVRFEPDHEAVMMVDDRPLLTWGRHAMHGNGWTLWYLDGNDSVDDHFIPGDLADVDSAVAEARRWLSLREDD